ncbi:hypothetical protein SAMN05444156_1778 [Verrucomicrobium sp. GAS474]|uniref:hypothetical protein n=1 Tax=Verrucomicrobium sp. GAS474 TaxID=1882831 RepID=UPI00087AA154|nr:hypothetical protein [Verrucomicrobium sp. GAS474]SDU06907.1 hypothetical protein SAMN05444156_1778 [Verrucomicrobium sp. GAS474]
MFRKGIEFRIGRHPGVVFAGAVLLAAGATLWLAFGRIPQGWLPTGGYVSLVLWRWAAPWAWLVIGALAWARAVEPAWVPGWLRGRAAFLLALAGGLAIARVPVLGLNQIIYADEASVLASGMAFLHDPVPWRSTDAISSGPLNIASVVPGLLLGLPPSIVGRILSLLCAVGTLYFLFRFLERLVGPGKGGLALFPLVTFYLVIQQREYLHYTNEQVSLLLLAAALPLSARLYEAPGKGRAFALGVVLGAVPWAKIQAAPIALYLLAVGGGILFVRRERARPVPAAAGLLAGFLVVPAIVVIPVAAAGLLGEMAGRYFLFAADYGPAANLAPDDPRIHFTLLQHLGLLLGNGAEGTAYLAGVAAWGGGALALSLAGKGARGGGLAFLAAGGYLLVSCAAALKPGTDFIHYLFFVFVPVLVAAAWASRYAFARLDPSRQVRGLVVAVALASAPAATFFVASWGFPDWRPTFLAVERREQPVDNALSDELRSLARPGDRMAVWGFDPALYVHAGIAPAARDVVTNFSIVPGRARDAHRRDYLDDLRRARPAFFVDAAAATWNPSWPAPPERSRHTLFPELAAFVAEHYVLVRGMTSDPAVPATLIFVRRDRAEELGLTATRASDTSGRARP